VPPRHFEKPLTEKPPEYNPYVSRTSPKGESKTIDFNEALPGIKKRIAAHTNEKFITLNKSLNKNQPLGESRKLMVNNPYLADVKVVLGGREYFGHKAFLATSSLLFHRAFAVANELKIDDSINEDVLLMLLVYCYSSALKLTQENVLDVLKAADKLEIKQASNICHGFISNLINFDSVFTIFEKAIEHQSELFQKKCMDFITAHEAKCFSSRGFYNIQISTLTAILGSCKFSNAKNGELIEKWNHGALNAALAEPGATGTKPKPRINNYSNNKQPKIPSLIDMVIPTPPLPEGPTVGENLINFDDEDDRCSVVTYDDNDDDAKSDIVCVDDDRERSQFIVAIRGNRKTMETGFSRIDLVTKRSILLHCIWFNENLFVNEKEVRVTVSVFENNKRSDIHTRVVKNIKSGEFE
jgi:hypothetical protein